MAPFRALTITAVSAVLATAACPGASSAGPATPSSPSPILAAGDAPQPGEPWLAYQDDDAAGGPRIALVRPDGTGAHLLVEQDTAYQNNPDWSPDGEWLTFTASDGARDDLYVAAADGTGLELLYDCRRRCAWLDDPAWSPDGRWIAVSRTDRDGVSSLQAVSPRTGRVRILLGPWRRSFTAGVRWSPDGERVVFERVRKNGTAFDADVTGVRLTVARPGRPRSLRPITDAKLFAATADWSPNGRRIVYSALPRPTSEAPDLYLIRPNGTHGRRLTRLARHDGFAAEPAWAPDGDSVTFVGTEGELLTVALDGTVAPVSDPALIGRHPRWRPGTDG